jgi:hypothetical protein
MKIVSTIATISKYIRVSTNLHMSNVEPAINEVEMQDLTFYLGADLVDEVAANIESETPTPRIVPLIPYIEQFISCLALYKAAPEIEVFITDNGILRREGSEDKTAFGGQVERFKELAGNRAYGALENALRILHADSQDYPEWEDSEYRKQSSDLLIKNAADFNYFENIKNSPLTYMALLSIMREVQEVQIKNSLPESIFEKLFTEPETPSISKILNEFVKPAIAKLTIADALISLPVDVDHMGVRVNQLGLISTGDNRTKSTAPNLFIEKKLYVIKGMGKMYLYKMADFLNTNATDYPEWVQSDFFEEPLKARFEKNKLLPEERKIYRS